jgi:hypothetical protein
VRDGQSLDQLGPPRNDGVGLETLGLLVQPGLAGHCDRKEGQQRDERQA